MRPGQRIRLRVPENARLDGAAAVVLEVTGYGARVRTPAAGSGEFRALFSEMVPEHGLANRLAATTGDVCSCCEGSNMIRTGACATCLDCGTSGGCA